MLIQPEIKIAAIKNGPKLKIFHILSFTTVSQTTHYAMAHTLRSLSSGKPSNAQLFAGYWRSAERCTVCLVGSSANAVKLDASCCSAVRYMNYLMALIVKRFPCSFHI